MKKSVVLILIITALALTGCGVSLPTGSSGGSIGVDTLRLEKGKVVLEEYSKETGASAEEIESFLKTELGSAPGVSLDKCSEKDGKICVKTSYNGMAAYTDFTGYKLGYGSVLDGRLAGYGFNETVYVVDGGVIMADTYSINDQDKFAAVYQPITVKVPGEIIAISDVAAVCNKDTAYVHPDEDGKPVIIIYK